MEDKIFVNLSADHTFECDVDIIGREGEGNTTRFEITIPEKLTGCSVYLDFEKPNREKLRTPRLEIENGVAVYDVVPYLLADDGEIKVQAVLTTDDGQTWKSSTKRYLIQNSINALEEIPEKEDFMTEAQKILDEIRGSVKSVNKTVPDKNGNVDIACITIADLDAICVFPRDAGLYQDGVMTASWDELMANGVFHSVLLANTGWLVVVAENDLVGELVISGTDGITQIAESGFKGCPHITSVTIPKSVTYLGADSFANCDSLTSITFEGTMAQWGDLIPNEHLGKNYWASNTPLTQIICSDGTITL